MEQLLLHPHAWVRVASSQLFGHLFVSYKPQDLVLPKATIDTATTSDGEEIKKNERKRKRKTSDVGVVRGVVSPEYLLSDPITKVYTI